MPPTVSSHSIEHLSMKLYQYFRKVRPDLIKLLILAICSYLIIELIFNNIPEIFFGAHKLAELFSKLSVAYVSAFIFYFVVIHIKNENDKHNINEFVGHKVYSIVTSAHLILQPMIQKFDKDAKFKYLTNSELSELLSKINRLDKEAPLRFSEENENANWIEWLAYLKESTQEDLKQIFVRYGHIDSSVIKMLSRIENSLYLTQFDLLYNFAYDKTFALYTLQIQTYLKLIKDLEEHADANFKEFKYRKGEFMGTM